MKSTDFAKSIENLPKKEKMAILEVIDFKVASEMKEVLAELRAMNTKFNVLIVMIGLITLAITIITALR